ncbi:MAG: TIR domain-containing protein [Flavobacterium sp.]|nr:MAG: TIR domain-containing protein [Flavobacterium sp.]
MAKSTEKIIIDGTASLMTFLEKNYPKSIGVVKKGFYEKDNRVVRKTFRNFTFKGDLHGIEFRGVKFINCDFDGIWGFFCIFQNCEFKECGIRNSRFSHLEFDWHAVYFEKCYFRNVEIDEGIVSSLIFDACTLVTCSFAGLFPSENIRFYDCEIEDSHFMTLQYYKDDKVERDDEYIDLLFQDCRIDASHFHRLNLKNSRFIDTVLYRSGFMDCFLENESFIVTKDLKYESYATMDFQTILQSDELSNEVLSSYFNIKTRVNLKEVISGMTTQKTFSTVFISYSFKDSQFAKKINDSLNNQGIRTFMWEKDAPGGKPLEDIMTSGIGGHDKLLFIAFEFSIRSKACQFELTTARKKQEASWENVFFPITIDDYLFRVKKNQIRPIELAEEYWENIEEIRRVNALDFSKFNTKDYDEEEFNLMFQKIVEGLKVGA